MSCSAINLGRSHSGTILNFAKDGSPLWNQLSIVPVRAKTGGVTHYIGMQTFMRPATCPTMDVQDAGLYTITRGGSHQCLQTLSENAFPNRLRFRSSSYQVLSALSPELVSHASLALHGCT
jgi:hypothetical protein